MTEFITGLVEVVTSLFTGILQAFAGVGELIFVVGEAGAITSVTPFGWILIVMVGIPLATWLFSKGIGLLSRLIRGGGGSRGKI